MPQSDNQNNGANERNPLTALLVLLGRVAARWWLVGRFVGHWHRRQTQRVVARFLTFSDAHASSINMLATVVMAAFTVGLFYTSTLQWNAVDQQLKSAERPYLTFAAPSMKTGMRNMCALHLWIHNSGKGLATGARLRVLRAMIQPPPAQRTEVITQLPHACQ